MRHDPASAAVVVMLRDLRMYGMAQAVGDLIEQGAPAFDAAVPILSQLLKAEMAEREVRSIAYQIKAAKLPAYKDLTGFDFTSAEVDEAMVRQLHQGDFIDGADNVVLIGGPGTGKTHIATALAVQAIEHRRRKARFFATVDLVNALEQEKAMNKAGAARRAPAPSRPRRPRRAGLPAVQLFGRRHAVPPAKQALRANQRHHHHKSQLQRVGRGLRRRQDDHRAPRPPHPPLPHRRNRQRQLPVPRPVRGRQTEKGEGRDLTRNSAGLTLPPRPGSLLDENAGSTLSGNQHADYPGLCKQAELSGPNNLEEQFTSGDTADMRVLESKALVAAVPGFAAARAALQRDAPPVHSTASTLRATIIAEPPPFAERSITAADHTPATAAAAVALAPLPPGFQLVRAEQQGSRAVAISVSQALDPTGEVSRGGYWVHLSADGGRHWARPMYTGLAERFPYVVEEQASAPLLVDETLQLAVSVAEIDTASITYPPVALRTLRQAHGLLLTIPLIALARDSDGDGISHVAAHHLLLDRPAPERPFRVGSDASAPCGPATAATMARIALLQRLVDPSGMAIVEPVDRPPAMIVGKVTRASAPGDQPRFLLGNPADFGCLRAARPILVYRHEQIAAITRMTPDFHAFELPPIVFNRTGDRGFARWSTGWAGGTYRLRMVNQRWVFDSINSWIT